MDHRALPFHEPGTVLIVVQSSFILLSNSFNFVLDRLLYCGLLGQITVGVIYGTPGAQLLSTQSEEAITQLGYLGLILLVFEGGLRTDVQALRRDLLLSTLVALTGIFIPIGLSFALVNLCDTSKLQAFAAGAALCSTSLGTTFTILKTSNLTKSRLGIILTSAAMLDDVIGLVLVQVISNLGESSSFNFSIILRPALVSLGFAVFIPIVCWVIQYLYGHAGSFLKKLRRIPVPMTSSQTTLVAYTSVLLAISFSGAFSGTSILFAAYLAGASISWLDELRANSVSRSNARGEKNQTEAKTGGSGVNMETIKQELQEPSCDTEHKKINRACDTDFRTDNVPDIARRQSNHDHLGHQVKIDVAPQIRSEPSSAMANEKQAKDMTLTTGKGTSGTEQLYTGVQMFEDYYLAVLERLLKPFFFASIGFSIPISQLFNGDIVWRGIVYAILMFLGKLLCGAWLIRFSKSPNSKVVTFPFRLHLNQYQAQSLYPSAILGSAMVARGEIGFLIAAVAQSNGIFSKESDRIDVFLVVIWAILLCTLIGPVMVGTFARRVKRLNKLREENPTGIQSPLGLWAEL